MMEDQERSLCAAPTAAARVWEKEVCTVMCVHECARTATRVDSTYPRFTEGTWQAGSDRKKGDSTNTLRDSCIYK